MTDDVKLCIDVLKKGGIILYPTDTIWGLGCDATNAAAVSKIYAIKQRSDEKSMLVLVDDENKLQQYAEIPEIAWDILQVTDKPLTIIYPEAYNLAKNLLAEDGSVGIRVTQDEFCCRIIRGLGKPIVSTSANISGKPWPASFKSIEKDIAEAVDYVVKYRQDEEYKGRPSGIIKLGIHGEVKVIRE
jgi:L-threonylcarbamoyladenylate synthase